MHLPAWFLYSLVVLVTWGLVGLLQKLSTNEISADAVLVWLVVGFMLMTPVFYPGKALWTYPLRSVVYILLSAALNALGAWALFAAMANGGKASIIVPLTALYPLVVVLSSPFILHESITLLQGVGVISSLAAVILLST